jgi:serine/threonine protein kinase
MTPERWNQVKDLFNDALDHNSDERTAFLDDACGGDEELRREVETLIAFHQKNDLYIDKPPFEAAAKLLADDTNSTEALIGRSIGHYRVERLIGQGGMGEVFLAKDTKLNRLIALKMLAGHSIKDPERIRRFTQEARAASSLNHPNIITIFEIGETEGLRFIATEFIEGETLRERMRRGEMELSEILDIVGQTANALAAAHQAGIAHRDIKPENIMLRSDGYAKVLDFGLAKLSEQQEMSEASRVSTQQGIVMGTVRYMSPEQARGVKTDTRTDIFSLGVVLFEMITGRLPFEGETNSDVIVSIITKKAPTLGSCVEDAPKELEQIVSKALHKNREERYQSIREMADDLDRFRKGATNQARMTEKIWLIKRNGAGVSGLTEESVISTAIIDAQKTSSTEVILNEIKRHKGAVISAIVVIIVLSASIAGSLYKQPGSGATALPVAARTPNFSKLIFTNNALRGLISPDGKYLTYSVLNSEGQSFWVKEISTGIEQQIVPPANVSCWDHKFSRDGKQLFCIRGNITSDMVLIKNFR